MAKGTSQDADPTMSVCKRMIERTATKELA